MAASTFAEVVASSSKPAPKATDLVFPACYQTEMNSGTGSLLPRVTRRAGRPALLFSDVEHNTLTEALKLTLVIKFYTRHPKMELVRDYFSRLGLLGSWTVGQLDPRHLLLRLSKEEDYTLIFGRRGLTIDEVGAKVIKWTSDFDFKKESPIIPIWLKFPGLKAHYFNKRVLFSLAAAFGNPLKLDAPTFNFSRPSCARVLVELDITSIPSNEIWIGTHHSGYWQEVIFEDIPLYCKKCCIFGHKLEECFIAHPELLPAKYPQNQTKSIPTLNTIDEDPPPTAPPPNPLHSVPNTTTQAIHTNHISSEVFPTTNQANAPMQLEPLHERTSLVPPPPIVNVEMLPVEEQYESPAVPEDGELPAPDSAKQPVDEQYESPADADVSSDDLFSETPLQRLESQLNDEWINPHAKKHKYKNKTTRELKSLLKDRASTLLATSSSRRPMRITQHSS